MYIATYNVLLTDTQLPSQLVTKDLHRDEIAGISWNRRQSRGDVN